MLIDTHIHTKRCHHAEGDFEDYIVEAIKKGIKIICFTEHAPLDFDKDKRLSEEEIIGYVEDIKRLKEKYKNKIEILVGFEIDYIEVYENKIKELIKKTNADFYLGSIHFIPFEGKICSIWDYEKMLNEEGLQEEYFRLIKKAINSRLFDSISHPDLIYRAGFNESDFLAKFKEIINELKTNNICYEINCSNMFKTKYDPELKHMKKENFLNKKIINMALKENICFTIGSDAHKPQDIGKGINEILEYAKNNKLKIIYFKNREKQELKYD